MAKQKTKTKEITIYLSKGEFYLSKKSRSSRKKSDFKEIASLKRLFTKEKAKILYIIKKEYPNSTYELAKKLGRNFKSVKEDLDLLKKLGIIEINQEKTKKRTRKKPIVVVDKININFNL